MTFLRSFFTFKNKSTPSLATTTLIIPSPTPYSHPPYSGSNIFLPPYPHDEFPAKPTPPASASYGGEARESVESEGTISKRASNRNNTSSPEVTANPFSDNHRVRASSSTDMVSQWRSNERLSAQSTSNLRDSKATQSLRRISSSFSQYDGTRSSAFLLMRQPGRAPVKYLRADTASRSSDTIATATGNEAVNERGNGVVNLIASDESQLEVDVRVIFFIDLSGTDTFTQNEQVESPAEINFTDTQMSDPEDPSPNETEPETTEDLETMVVDQSFSQTSQTPVNSPEDSIPNEIEPEATEDDETVIVSSRTSQTPASSPTKRSSPTSKLPKAVKFAPKIFVQPPTPTVSSLELDSETQRLSMMSVSSEQSAASSTTFSFTTGCSSAISECSFGSTESMDSSSTVRPRRDSSSSTSTIKPNHLGSLKKESENKPQTKWDLPRGAVLIYEEEYKDYTYVVYSDKKGREWGKMYPKQKTIRKSL
ncbi:hypothetical protein Clacol_000142 [Clathrus columnatus]|uniref:Uncharacterized protein n=1 Tax=Clathrus columnatus TaxID=1419009 RepID=A0AAV4ZWN9_9AGAM|nr:hypothetical protein Clacol_000142 [Clathrus columnatus]